MIFHHKLDELRNKQGQKNKVIKERIKNNNSDV